MSKQMLELADKLNMIFDRIEVSCDWRLSSEERQQIAEAANALRCSADSDALRDQAFKTVEVLETSEIKFDMAYRLFVAKQLRKAMRNEPQTTPHVFKPSLGTALCAECSGTASAPWHCQADTIAVPRVALEWLFGAEPDADGKWFGDCEEEERKTPRKPSRPYWWRTKFRSMIPALTRSVR